MPDPGKENLPHFTTRTVTNLNSMNVTVRQQLCGRPVARPNTFRQHVVWFLVPVERYVVPCLGILKPSELAAEYRLAEVGVLAAEPRPAEVSVSTANELQILNPAANDCRVSREWPPPRTCGPRAAHAARAGCAGHPVHRRTVGLCPYLPTKSTRTTRDSTRRPSLGITRRSARLTRRASTSLAAVRARTCAGWRRCAAAGAPAEYRTRATPARQVAAAHPKAAPTHTDWAAHKFQSAAARLQLFTVLLGGGDDGMGEQDTSIFWRLRGSDSVAAHRCGCDVPVSRMKLDGTPTANSSRSSAPKQPQRRAPARYRPRRSRVRP
jgi:hypothetical protein